MRRKRAGRKYHEDDEDRILSVASNLNTVIVWHHSDVNEKTEKFIYENKDRLMPFVIAPGEMPITVEEKLVLIVNEKFGILNNFARKIYQSECQRILPNINVLSMKNMSGRKKFYFMSNSISKNN